MTVAPGKELKVPYLLTDCCVLTCYTIGLMLFTARMYQVMQMLGLGGISLETVCVFVPPCLAAVTTILVYHLTTLIKNERAGLVAACLFAVVPASASRTGAGAFNTDSIGIPYMLVTFYAYLKATQSGTMGWSMAAAVSYYCVVSSWEGYFFVWNLIPLHVVCLMVLGRYTPTVYTAYSVFYIVGMLLSFQVPSVSALSILSPQHIASFIVFVLCQIYAMQQLMSSHFKGAGVKGFDGATSIVAYTIAATALPALWYLQSQI